MPAFSGQDSSRVVSNYWRVADAIRKKCCSQDMCFSFGIGKGIDFQRGSKGLSAGGGVRYLVAINQGSRRVS